MNSILRCGKCPRRQLYARKVEAPDFFKMKLAHGTLPCCSLWINFGSNRGGGFNRDRQRAAEPVDCAADELVGHLNPRA